MFLNNSYFNVLRKIDKNWEGKHPTRPKDNLKRGNKRISRSSSQSSKSRCDAGSFSSAESGHYSEDCNSGYYGDDEIEPCPRCREDLLHRGPKPNLEEYDIISIEVSVKTQGHCRHSELVNFDDFVVIPSSREEFCAGNLKHSTPIPDGNPFDAGDSHADSAPQVLVTCTPKIVTCESRDASGTPKGLHSHSCVCFSPQKPVRFRLDAPPRSSFTDIGVWWRENITWQLRQRNKTQTQNFIQLQDLGNNTRPKVKINREIAHYLNRYGAFRPHNELLNTALVEMEPNALDKSDLLAAIRSHGAGTGEDTRTRTNSVVQLAQVYIRKQNTTVANVALETDDEDANKEIVMRRRSRAKLVLEPRGRLFIPRWKESITNQLQMRNFLECKYFTDAIVRRSLSQISISMSQGESKSAQDMEDYDVITSDDVTSVLTLMNSSQSTSQGYHSAPAYTGNNIGGALTNSPQAR